MQTCNLHMYVSFTQIQDFSGGMVGHKKAKMRIEMSLQSGSLLCSLNTMHNSMLNELLKKIEMTVHIVFRLAVLQRCRIICHRLLWLL